MLLLLQLGHARFARTSTSLPGERGGGMKDKDATLREDVMAKGGEVHTKQTHNCVERDECSRSEERKHATSQQD